MGLTIDNLNDEAKEYLDKFCASKNISKDEAFTYKLVRGIVSEKSGYKFNWNTSDIDNK